MSMQTYYIDPMDPKNLEYKPSYNFHDWCAERELNALDHAWECEIQDIYEKFFDAHRYTSGAKDETEHKAYLDDVERTLNRELEAVNKVYEEKRDEIMAKFLENMSENDKIPSQELNITHCPDCKYCVKTKDGEYNPDDIVRSYWNSDGLESGDFCSYGEKGEYEWCDNEIHVTYGRWITKNNKKYPLECSECGYEVPKDGYFSRYCPMCGVKMVNFKELEEKFNEN